MPDGSSDLPDDVTSAVDSDGSGPPLRDLPIEGSTADVGFDAGGKTMSRIAVLGTLAAAVAVIAGIALIARNGDVVSRAALLDEVWGDRFVVDASVTRCIGALRSALHDEAPHRYIETLPKRGYRFVADVRDCTGLPECDPRRGSCLSIMEGVSTRRRPDGVIR